MKEIYRLIRLLIEFMAIHPLRFRVAIFITTFIVTILIIITIWRLLKKKQKNNNKSLKKTIIVTEVEPVKQEPPIQKGRSNSEKPHSPFKTKIDEEDLELNEQIDDKSKSKKQLSKAKGEKTKPTDNFVLVNPVERKAPLQKRKAVSEKPHSPRKTQIDKGNLLINEQLVDNKSIDEEQLPEAKVETTKSEDEVLFVNYDFPNAETLDSYPVFRFPKRGTVVRSYRLGNTKRRGFKEESFQKSIEQCFGENFMVLGNARLNTGKETRPFEPDIAIIDKSNTTNLRIDIEIDEPYAGITRQPTHCKGDDVNRDIYFIDRGWVVIRFSEYQVHLQESSCLHYIAETIKSAIPKYIIPNQLINQPTLQVEKLWDMIQAQKWEKIKYREHYLNHSFQFIEDQIETIERDFDEQELKEENLVKPTLIGKVDNKSPIAYNLRNAHSRDSRIKFYPEPHIYTIDNTPAPSASTIIAKFFPEFDAVYWADRKAPELGMTPAEVELMWLTKGQDAAKDGTFLHEQIENFYLEQKYERTEEFHLFESFVNEHSHMKPYRTEWRIFDEQHHIAGTIDLISKNGNDIELYDWKRSKKVINVHTGEPITSNQWQRGIGYLSDIEDTSYNRYCLQQSLYKFIIEKNYGLEVSKMFLIVLYPNYDKYYKIEVPYLKDKVEYILKTL